MRRGTQRLGSFCTGYGGLDLAVGQVFDIQHMWHAEIDSAASKVLDAHWPDVPNHGDLTAVDWSSVEPVDILTAGFPCQPVSAAGRRQGLDDERWLFDEIADAVGRMVTRPRLLVFENVPGLLTANRGHAMARVVHRLAALGYVGRYRSVRASDVGAAHRRERVFIVARLATDTASIGHGHAWPEGVGGMAPTTVAGAPADADCDAVRQQPVPVAGRGGATVARGSGPGACLVSLLPTPTAAERDRTSEEAARRHLRSAGPDLSSVVVHQLLPTPAARAGGDRGTPNTETAHRRMYDEGRRNLEDAVALLPTPMVSDGNSPPSDWAERPYSQLRDRVLDLLPKPRATDGTKGGPNQRGSSGDLMLPSAVMLLPTPTAQHAARNATAGRSPGAKPFDLGWTLADIAYADRWGEYGAAIARWEHATGRPAPEPTETGTKGQPRLAPPFVEWLMGLPAGWVTDHLPRNAALRVLGNGVVPQQAAYAVADLAGVAS